jgi:hypothetical protein
VITGLASLPVLPVLFSSPVILDRSSPEGGSVRQNSPGDNPVRRDSFFRTFLEA